MPSALGKKNHTAEECKGAEYAIEREKHADERA
jgi:hypothetical protein